VTIRSKVKIPPLAAADLQNDLDDAIKRRDVESIRRFSREAELSGMDQEAARGFELANVIEAKAGDRAYQRIDALERPSARAELTRIKSALGASPPSQADLVRAFDVMLMNQAAPFDRDQMPDLERRRSEESNCQLAERRRKDEEERARQAARHEPEPEPWWRR
jgi:hypothetical protein